MGDSVELARLARARGSSADSFWPHLDGWILLALLVALYHSILYRLAVQWANDPNFSHGFFVPAFALFVLWQNRTRLRAVPIGPSWSGLPLIAFALVMLLFGVLGVELFTSRASFLVLIAGLIILFRGWPMFRAVLFPWAFSFLMIPLPALILQRFTFPLQIFASKLAAWSLQAVGIPVLREGNVIVLASLSLEVAEACSGIRSLVSLVTLAIIYGYVVEQRNWVRVLLACSAVPIAVIANVFRIFGTGLCGQLWDPDKAQGFFHEFQGWLVFVVSLLLLFAFHRIVNWIWKPKPVPPPSPTTAGGATPAHNPPARAWSPRFFASAALMLATVFALQAHSQDEVLPPRPALSAMPSQYGNWVGTDDPLDAQTLEVLGPGEFLMRDYEDANQREPWVNLFVAYFPSQKMGDTIHSPSHCLPGAGWVPTEREVITLNTPMGASFPVNRYVVSKAGERELVLYWFQAHGREVASEYTAKYYLIQDSIRLHRSDGALIRLMTPMFDHESPDAAQARMMQLGNQFFPFLDRSIPR
ncbi:MAG: VPLPA-CTERM-specific exosortase XrtD [Terriglobales bacterium]